MREGYDDDDDDDEDEIGNTITLDSDTSSVDSGDSFEVDGHPNNGTDGRGSCCSMPDDQERFNIILPLYYTQKPVKKPASVAYRMCSALMCLSLVLRGLGVVLVVSQRVGWWSADYTYAKNLGLMACALIPLWLDCLVVAPATVLVASTVATNLSRMARHARSWVMGAIMWVSELLACSFLQFAGVVDEDISAYALLFPAAGLFVCAIAICVCETLPHDAPSRGYRWCWAAAIWIWRRWPYRWDSALLPGHRLRGGTRFAEPSDAIPLFAIDDDDNESGGGVDEPVFIAAQAAYTERTRQEAPASPPPPPVVVPIEPEQTQNKMSEPAIVTLSDRFGTVF